MSVGWSQMEYGAISNFIATPGPLMSGLEKFVEYLAQENRKHCAASMATVPRNPELAADHAAKAQLLDEFWFILADVLTQERTGSTEAPASAPEEEV